MSDPIPGPGNGQTLLSPAQRDTAWNRLGAEQFDVIVIGGGVVGAGAALDAATRGLKVALGETEQVFFRRAAAHRHIIRWLVLLGTCQSSAGRHGSCLALEDGGDAQIYLAAQHTNQALELLRAQVQLGLQDTARLAEHLLA